MSRAPHAMPSPPGPPTTPGEPAYEPGLLARSPQFVLTVAVAVSVVLHAVLIWFTLDRPLGYVDLAVLRPDREPLQIKRASFDTFAQPRTGDTTRAESGPSELATLASAVIEQAEPEVPTQTPEDEVNLRDLDEQPPDRDPSELAVELPPFELPNAAVQELAPSRPTELSYRDSALAGTDVRPADANTAARTALTSLTPTAGQGEGPTTGAGQSMLAPADDRRPIASEPVVALDVPQIAVPELDLPEAAPPEPAVNLDDDFEYRVSRYAERREPAGWFRVQITAKRSLRKLRAMPKDVVYLIDTSSSLPQSWVEQVTRGVAESLPALNDGDRFNIVMFNQSPTALSTQRIQPVNAETLAAARRFLDGAQSEGWTDVNAALRRLLVRDTETQRAYVLVLISDGQPTRGVTDTRDLINLITRDNDLAAGIYCIGVGDRQNTELLDFLAYRNKGRSIHVKRRDDAAPAIRDLLSELRYPLIKNVRLGFAGLDRGTVFPLDLPDIHQGQTFEVFGRYDADNPERFTMRIAGISADGPVDFTFTRNLAEAPAGDDQIARSWAFQKLHFLYSEIIRLGQREQLLDQIERLR
ncbi:MAG: VWA domain-containing protein, partial [Deinococcus-Thermus bacterium]|nr:VWA domain-containing protein [Deinococcota bacterium]